MNTDYSADKNAADDVANLSDAQALELEKMLRSMFPGAVSADLVDRIEDALSEQWSDLDETALQQQEVIEAMLAQMQPAPLSSSLAAHLDDVMVELLEQGQDAQVSDEAVEEGKVASISELMTTAEKKDFDEMDERERALLDDSFVKSSASSREGEPQAKRAQGVDSRLWVLRANLAKHCAPIMAVAAMGVLLLALLPMLRELGTIDGSVQQHGLSTLERVSSADGRRGGGERAVSERGLLSFNEELRQLQGSPLDTPPQSRVRGLGQLVSGTAEATAGDQRVQSKLSHVESSVRVDQLDRYVGVTTEGYVRDESGRMMRLVRYEIEDYSEPVDERGRELQQSSVRSEGNLLVPVEFY